MAFAVEPELEEWVPQNPGEFHEFESQKYTRAFLRSERDGLDSHFDDDYDVTYYHLTVDVRNYSARTIYGQVLMNANIIEDDVDSLGVNFCSSMIMDSIVSAELGALSFQHANHFVTVDLGRTYAAGESVSLRFYYHGTPCQINSQWSFWFYTRSVGPASVPAIHTLSESIGARDWWPCKDLPEDKADSARISIICADSLTATSNGVLESSVALPPSSKNVTWFESLPITTYLITINVTNYRRFDDWYVALNGDSVPIQHYTYPERYNQALASWSTLPQMMQAFAERFGEYPFASEKYGHTMCNYPGGMEHQCNTSYGRSITTGSHFYDYVIAHEAAHQWWGDCVTLYDWPDVWLNEGFASYCEALWIEEVYGLDSLRGYQMSPSGNDVVDPSGPVYNPSVLFSGNTVYDKGSWILHMLRGIVRNDSVFFAIFSEYRARYGYSVATTTDFLTVASEVSGLDIASYLHAYLYRTNRPVYNVAFGSGMVDDEVKTVVRISQTQVDPDTTFRTRLDLAFNGESIVTTVENFARSHRYYFDLGLAPSSLTVDPDFWVLRTVQNTALPVTVLNTELDSPVYHLPYSEQLVATGGTAPYAWTLVGGTLPGEYTFFADGRITSPIVSNLGEFPVSVRVVDQAGGADTVNFVLTTTPLIPPPSSLTIYRLGSSLVMLRWKTDVDMDSFRVWRDTNFEMTQPVLLATTTELEFTDSTAATNPDSLIVRRARYYSVTAVRND